MTEEPKITSEMMQTIANEATEVAAMPVDYLGNAHKVMANSLFNLAQVGAQGQYFQNAMAASRSRSEQITGEPQEPSPPLGPGFSYLSHLFKRTNAKKKMKDKEKKASEDGINIYSDHMEALKTALSALGVYSDKNPGGMPIDIKEARKIWFGKEAIDGMKEAEWRSLVEMGDRNIDPKKIRKFVNYDGSMTWEILNDDKTVMSRFTLGEAKGQKVFTQGGYAKFAEVLKKIKSEGGAGDEFDSFRGSLAGSG